MNMYNPVTKTILRPNVITTPGVMPSVRRMVQSPIRGQSVTGSMDRGIAKFRINESAPDAMSIISFLQRMADQYGRDPGIRALVVKSIACSDQDNDLLGRFRQIVRFVRERLNYIPDPIGSELVVSPIKLLNKIIAGERPEEDCDGHVLLLATLLQSIGIRAIVAGVKVDSPDRFNHVIVTAYLDGSWHDVDPCDKQGVNPSFSEKLLPS
jgi:hypothetical protein